MDLVYLVLDDLSYYSDLFLVSSGAQYIGLLLTLCLTAAAVRHLGLNI